MRVTSKRKVVVVGGGITGLTAAYYLQQATKHLPIEVIVVEAALRVGGKIQTMRKNGFIIERGPESFVDATGSVKQLATDLGIEHKLIYNNSGRTYVAVGKELFPVPSNLLLGGSPNVTSLMATGLISLSGKIRAVGDLFLPKSQQEDEPIGDFFRRRFGKEVVENLVEPLLAGTFAGDIDHLSIHSMFPQFYQLEKDYRSLIVGMTKQNASMYAQEGATAEQLHYGTFEGGLETLIETLEQALEPGTVVKGTKVEAIEKLKNDKMKITLTSMPPIQADDIIMTTPFNAAKHAFKKYDLMQQVPSMNYATIATVTMAFKKEELQKYQDAINFFVSRNSELAITSCTWSNRKWPGVAPEGYELLRVYIGRVGDEAIVELSDSKIEKTVLADLRKILDLQEKPIFTVVTRWKQAMPQYVVGHEQRLQQLKDELSDAFPHVYLVGSSYEGISMPDCIKQGHKIAQELLNSMIPIGRAQ